MSENPIKDFAIAFGDLLAKPEAGSHGWGDATPTPEQYDEGESFREIRFDGEIHLEKFARSILSMPELAAALQAIKDSK